jgi:SAM-dependent methyltransferase
MQKGRKYRILDLGSYDVNGSYRPLFQCPDWKYEGADLQPGPNVDIVLADPYSWSFRDNSFNVIISGQAFEHFEFFWLTWKEMARVLKPGGFIFLIVPSCGPEHKFPVDCWRFYADGMRALGKLCRLEVLEAVTRWENPWGDTIGVFQKLSRIASIRKMFLSGLAVSVKALIKRNRNSSYGESSLKG